jgi:uncharacterized damage-inducible protein DinB
MFASIKEFTEFWSQEADRTRRVLGAMPDAKLSFKPHEKSRSAAEVAWHCVTSPRWFAGEMMKLALKDDFGKKYPKEPAKAAEFVKAYDLTVKAVKSAVESQKDDWLAKKTDFLGQKLPNGVILAIMLFHETHHRGQLSVYLRPMGGKVPGIYGPSADSE